MKLTEAQIINIIEECRINSVSADERDQVMRYVFGDDYMESDDKGSKKQYAE
jgi:hypothetical protein